MIEELTLEERSAIEYAIQVAARWGEHLDACGLRSLADEAHVSVGVLRRLMIRDLEVTG